LFNIDLVPTVSTTNNEIDLLPDDENVHPNRLIESLIINKIHTQQLNISGCFACEQCYGQRVLEENRKMIEVSCNGLINCNFCEIPESFGEELFPEDFIIVQHEDSNEIAQIRSVGDIVNIHRNYLGLFGEHLPIVIRKATKDDLEKVQKNIFEEEKAIPFFRAAVVKFNLNMKLVSIHYQYDRKKLFFFYTSDGRVDFRELAKELAAEFKTRIELRQIGVRDEAKKVGGVGTCGREYCCISFLSSFRRITTHLATDQNLFSSMGKLSGPCGKLKCCLSFEID
jgi:cell fate regulator YaaT (PSP1 superfamily)